MSEKILEKIPFEQQDTKDELKWLVEVQDIVTLKFEKTENNEKFRLKFKFQEGITKPNTLWLHKKQGKCLRLFLRQQNCSVKE